jgi:MFS transporter, UMF1 family
MIKKDDRKIINAWAFYDWANSAYPLVITTSIFPLFFQSRTNEISRIVDGHEVFYVDFFGREFINTEIYSYVFSFSFLIVSFLSPILSGVADISGRKKLFLKIFCYIGALSCALLYFFDGKRLEISMVPVFMASVGFWGSLVFYNAFLPEIASNEMQDGVSAKGFSLGYIGSALLLIVILVLSQSSVQMPIEYGFVMVAVWWIAFAQYTYAFLPENVFDRKPIKRDLFSKGFKELRSVWSELKEQKNLRAYLRSFFVSSMGVQTVMLMAVLFAKKEIDWGGDGDTGLIASILIIQFIGALGAFIFSKLSQKFGNKPILGVVLLIWIGACVGAYVIKTPSEFYMLAGVVGLVMGGVQSLSRSTYSKLLPQTEDHASYFSFYDVVEKVGIVIGTFLFGYIEGVTSSMRSSALILLSFFAVGFILLLFVKNEKSIAPIKS